MRGVNALSVHWLWADATGKEALAVESPWRQEQAQEPVEGEYLEVGASCIRSRCSQNEVSVMMTTRVSRRVSLRWRLSVDHVLFQAPTFISSKAQQRQCVFR
jgi:hypothetical protein